MLRDDSSTPEPLGSRFRLQLTAEVSEGGRSVVIGGQEFRTAELLESAGQGWVDVFRSWKEDDWLPAQRLIRDACIVDKTSKRRYDLLLQRVQSGSLMAFIGSGCAKAYGYPLWNEFLVGLLEWAQGLDEESLTKVVREKGYEDAASCLCSYIHPRHWDEQLVAEFGMPPKGAEKIVAPVQWVPLISPSGAVTTNYDPIIESVFDYSGTPFDAVLFGRGVSRLRNLRSSNKRCLVKIHGDREHPDTRVLTREEYDQAYSEGSEARREIKLLFQTNNLLFLGCSLTTDRTMDLLRGVAESDAGMPPHFALLKRPENKSEWLKRDAFLLERGIQTLWYTHDHDIALEGLLGMLAFESERLGLP